MSLSSVVLSGLHRMKRDHRQFARVTEEFFDQDEDMGPYAAFREDSATSVYEAVPLLGPFGPEELTLEWDGKEDTLRSFLFSSCWCPPPGNNPRSSVEGRVGPPPVFVGLAARLTRLHLIGYDPLSPFDGFSLPIETLVNSVIAGSLQATHRLVQARRLACDMWRDQARRDASREDSVIAENAGSSLHLQSHFDGSERGSAVPDQPTRIPCVTHLRYDTVKFTLRPFEALAPRLRPLFEHLHVSGASYPPRLTNSNRNQTPRTRHPYHDSAIRATLKDGSYQIPLADLAQGRELSDVAKANEAADYHLRTAFGAGSFARLHLAWDLPPPPEEGNEQLTSQMAALSVSAAESGWPTERRDVWTNYSTPSRSAAAGASKTAKSRAGPSNADSPFTMELVEAIEHRLQYPFTQQLFEARRYNTYPSKPLMQTRPPEETQRLRNDSSLWPSETERDADALGKLLGQDFLLHVGGELPLNPEYQPLLEMVPISPYAAVPDGPVQLGPDLPRGSQRNFTTVSRPRAEPILRLGGAYAAFTSDERTRLFMERIKGKAGSW
ncbi:hypothetical protein CF336_g4042 [Tilletia laevis]|nr:hypothetical protein CF336_g4042 [Tilletia laevis]